MSIAATCCQLSWTYYDNIATAVSRKIDNTPDGRSSSNDPAGRFITLSAQSAHVWGIVQHLVCKTARLSGPSAPLILQIGIIYVMIFLQTSNTQVAVA